MCGIIGYLGYRSAAPLLVEGLKTLEYRGYDSFGIATVGNSLQVFKVKGKISEFDAPASNLTGTIGIGHTRWATHGEPSDVNAHPHCDCQGRIAVVHNGIIENYAALKKELMERGHHFVSETDTEVIAHLIEDQYTDDLFQAVSKSIPALEGSYALLVVAAENPSIIAVRNRSPLVLGIGDHELLAASDVTPLLDYTKQIIYLEDGDIASLGPQGIALYHGGQRIERPVEQTTWQKEDIKQGGFAHFMMKEIYEQPRVFYETYRASRDTTLRDLLKTAPNLTVVACGSSYHASLVFKYLAEEFCHKPVRVDLASEFKYFTPPLSGPVIGVTQSGETADTLSALKQAKMYNCLTLAITNVQGSTVTREADRMVLMRAGPELSVAATKSFIAQLAVFMQITNLLCKNCFDETLAYAHRALEQALLLDLTEAVTLCKDAQHIFYIGRGPFYPVAQEGALKMKEISYIHAEAYAAGELKHGPFALLTPSTPVVAICPSGPTRSVMISNLKEVKARKAPLLVIGEPLDTELKEIADVFIPLAKGSVFEQILTATVILQLLAYQAARELNCEIDKPRNLAKSVTVE
jgi:glucosamine--fructose-6-phosphate aminotransferase (isomerizing)